MTGVRNPFSGFDGLIGVEVEATTPERVSARLRITDVHLQPYGVVHGGVYAALAETVASVGAAAAARARDPRSGAVGLENHTTFVRAARAGIEVVAVAAPLHAGRRTSVWSVEMREAVAGDRPGRLLAHSTVRLLVTAPDAV